MVNEESYNFKSFEEPFMNRFSLLIELYIFLSISKEL